jgi:hypothetical protein
VAGLLRAVRPERTRRDASGLLSQARDQPPAQVEGERRPEGLAQRRRDQQREDAVGGAGGTRAEATADDATAGRRRREARADEGQPRLFHLRVLEHTKAQVGFVNCSRQGLRQGLR